MRKIVEELIIIIKEFIGYEVSINDRIESLNMDSIEFVKLMVVIENKFNIEFSPELLLQERLKTIEDIVDIIYKERI